MEQRGELLEAMLGLADDNGWVADVEEPREDRADSGGALVPNMSVNSLDQLEALHRDSYTPPMAQLGGGRAAGSPPRQGPASPPSPPRKPVVQPPPMRPWVE